MAGCSYTTCGHARSHLAGVRAANAWGLPMIGSDHEFTKARGLRKNCPMAPTGGVNKLRSFLKVPDPERVWEAIPVWDTRSSASQFWSWCARQQLLTSRVVASLGAQSQSKLTQRRGKSHHEKVDHGIIMNHMEIYYHYLLLLLWNLFGKETMDFHRCPLDFRCFWPFFARLEDHPLNSWGPGTDLCVSSATSCWKVCRCARA